MIVNFKIFNLFLVSFVFYLLGEFCIPISKFVIPYYFIVGTILFYSIIIFNYKKILEIFKIMIKTKPFVYLFFFILWVILTILVSIIQGTFILPSFFTNFLGNFFSSFLFPIFIGIFSVLYIQKINAMKKFLFIVFLLLLIIGIIHWFAVLHNISLVKDIMSIFVNRDILLRDVDKLFILAFDKPRISTIFREPGEYAGFLLVSLPLFLYFFRTKEQIFKIKYIDSMNKILLFILYWINLLFTQSPINIVFVLIVLFLLFFTNIKFFIQKYFRQILSFILLLIIGICVFMSNSEFDIETSFLSRILKVASNLKSITNIVYIEPSLGTRICCHEAQLRMAFDYPIFGVGYANVDSVWAKYILNLPHVITPEIYDAALDGKQRGGAGFLWKILSETGFIGAFLLYTFWFSLYIWGIKISKTLLEKDFICALSLSLLVYISFSFYLMLAPIFLVYFGILAGFILKHFITKKKSQTI